MLAMLEARKPWHFPTFHECMELIAFALSLPTYTGCSMFQFPSLLLPFPYTPLARGPPAPLYIHPLGQQTLASNAFHLPDPLACLEHCHLHISERHPELATQTTDATHRHAVSLPNPPARSSPVHLPDLRYTFTAGGISPAQPPLHIPRLPVTKVHTSLLPDWHLACHSYHQALPPLLLVHATCTVRAPAALDTTKATC
jgi:hypothetical protein